MGMSNFNKNLFVGLGGKEAIDLSHFIGACYGMEKMMGRADNPLRRILNRASDDFLRKLPLVKRTCSVPHAAALFSFCSSSVVGCVRPVHCTLVCSDRKELAHFPLPKVAVWAVSTFPEVVGKVITLIYFDSADMLLGDRRGLRRSGGLLLVASVVFFFPRSMVHLC